MVTRRNTQPYGKEREREKSKDMKGKDVDLRYIFLAIYFFL